MISHKNASAFMSDEKAVAAKENPGGYEVQLTQAWTCPASQAHLKGLINVWRYYSR